MTSDQIDRRRFLTGGARAVGAVGLGALGGFLVGRQSGGAEWTWQLDPAKCVACGNCATHCVLDISAVKCLHTFPMCGYCKLCTGYFDPEPNALNSGAENQLCPTGAVKRRFIEDPYYEYEIEEDLCIGCGKCVKGCNTFGNGSLYLQVRRTLCVNCNECSIAVACPSQAFSRVPATAGYLARTAGSVDVESPAPSGAPSAGAPPADDTSSGEPTK